MTFTEALDGDFATGADAVDARRALIDPRPWSWCRQVHGADVVVVDHDPSMGEEADNPYADEAERYHSLYEAV